MNINIELLKDFEKTIDTIHPETGKIPIKILGFGEISLVFEIIGDSEQLAYKRIPIFKNEKQVRRHVWAYNEYCRIIEKEIGLILPEHKVIWFLDDNGKIQFYSIQAKIDPESVGNKIIHQVSDDEIEVLVLLVLRELKKVWTLNKENSELEIGLDGQISNFVVMNYESKNPTVTEKSKLLYLDTSTPMLRKNGTDAMEGELFLNSTPSFLRFLIKAFFIQSVLDRYYDLRLVIIDLLANFFKEQLPKIIPRLIKRVNIFLKEEISEFEIAPIRLAEVQKYYKSDKMIWVIFQKARRIDRYIKTKLLKKNYDFYLPEKIKR
ncbi:MAG: DUF6206 family protein [Promethearchaeota archaeon]|jgi:hypothetical protein